jgi:dihydroorotase
VETCPQYLLLNTDMMQALGKEAGIMRVNPPIREPGHEEPLWQALLDGTVDMIATDHAPHSVEEKTRENIWQCDCGFPGVETQMPIMLTEVNKGRASINQYVRWSAANPAKAWGLYGRKGVIQAGAEADIVLVDMNVEQHIDQGSLFSKSKISPWHGRRISAKPVLTMVRGRVVMQDGEIVAKAGTGRAAVQKMPAPAPRNLDKTTAAILDYQG